MDATNNIATDLFYKIRSRFSGLKLGTADGMITINPEEARFFDFDYMDGSNALGHVSISLSEENSLKVYFSTGITESMDSTQKSSWYSFLKELRNFAKRRLMAFDTRDIAKDNLDKRDYAFLSQYNKPKPVTKDQIIKPVGEAIMSESALYGTKTMSYQKLLDTRLIIKHKNALTDDQQPGARTRNISALFVENQDGERYKYPFIHLSGARAMQRHVANGGVPYDDIGKSIIKMSEEIAQLKSFSNYVVRNDLMNSDNNSIIERATTALNTLREQIAKISKQSHYEAYKESFQAAEELAIPEEMVEDFKDKFTVKNFKEDIKSVFPILYRLMQEDNIIGYDDIVEMTASSPDNDTLDVDVSEDEFEKYENWIINLGEESAVTSDDEEERTQAVKDLQELVKQHFPAGVDGSNAIESLKGIIDDQQLFKEIKEQAKEDPDSCVRPLIKDWLEQNAPEVVNELDFGDMVEEPAEEPAKEGFESSEQEQQVRARLKELEDEDPDNMYKIVAAEFDMDEEELRDALYSSSKDEGTNSDEKLSGVQELAEFIHSFYDKDSGTFPKGPEGVCTMVGKKFGEQAEQVARKFVERMAPQQTTEHNPELAELARLKELSGISQGIGF